MLLVDVVGNGLSVAPEQIGEMVLKVGSTAGGAVKVTVLLKTQLFASFTLTV
jgi:hypothetical protein